VRIVEKIMKRKALAVLMISLFVQSLHASLSMPYVIYSVEYFSGDFDIKGIPDFKILVPTLYSGNVGQSCDSKVSRVYNKLREKEPDIYKKIIFIEGKHKDDVGCYEIPVEFKVLLSDEEKFINAMSELVYSLNWHPTAKEIKIKFVFTDSKLKKKYETRIFLKKDVKIPVFELKLQQ
jgi:hypothetical protein